MAIISKNIPNTDYSDQHKPIKINWATRSFDFQEPYVISVNKDLNSQLLIFECDGSYDGVSLDGTNIYVDYSTDWLFNDNMNSQGSVFIDPAAVQFDDSTNKLKIQWLLNQLQTYRSGKVKFGLTFQMERIYDSQYFFSWDNSNNLGWKQNFWFKVLNPTAEKSNWLLALIKNENEFEIEKNNHVNGINTCITIGSTVINASTANPYDAVIIKPDDWDDNYSYYMKKSTLNGVDYYSFYDNDIFDGNNCYKNKFIGLSYAPQYVLKTLPGVFVVEKGLDITESQFIPTTDNGLINEKILATKDEVIEVKSQVDTIKNNYIDYITPETYGAVGDAKTDDTAALSNAFNAAAEQKKALVLQDKIYLTSQTLNIGNDMFIDGNGATIIAMDNIDLLKITGSNNTIQNLKLTFKAQPDANGKQQNIPGGVQPYGGITNMSFEYKKNLIYILSSGKSVLRNTFSNVWCYSQINPYYDWKPSLFQGTGIRIETTNSPQSYVYAHNFSNCKVNCMKVGLRIKNQSNMGINANTYGIDFWACRTGVWGNPSGSLFRGSHQSPQYVAGYGYVLTGSKNKFEGIYYDTRYSTSVPSLATDVANIYGSSTSGNSISGGRTENYNFTNPSDYTLLTNQPDDWDSNYTKYYKNWGYESSDTTEENVKVFRPVMAGGAPKWEAGKYYRMSGSSYVLLTEKPAMWESQKFISANASAYYKTDDSGNYVRVIAYNSTVKPIYEAGIYYSFSGANTISPLQNDIVFDMGTNVPIPTAHIGLPNSDAQYRVHTPFNPTEYDNSLLSDELDIQLDAQNLRIWDNNKGESAALYGTTFPMNLKPLLMKTNKITKNAWGKYVPREQLCLYPINDKVNTTLTISISQNGEALKDKVALILDSLCLYCVITTRITKIELNGYNYDTSAKTYSLVNTKNLTLDGVYYGNGTGCIAGNFGNVNVAYSKIELKITFSNYYTTIANTKIYLNHIYGRITQRNANSRWPIVPSIIDIVYPVGSIYMSVNNVNPQNIFGGTWEQLQNRFLLGAGDTYAAGATGGEATVALDKSHIPAHTHDVRLRATGYDGWSSYTTTGYGIMFNTDNSGSVKYLESGKTLKSTDVSGYATTGDVNGTTEHGQPHNNMPPYLAVYMWKRTG